MPDRKTITDFLRSHVLRREEVDAFLDPQAPHWARFDAELGYVLHDCTVQDGMDGSYTIGAYLSTGERRVINYAELPCRLSCFGDSFTMCHQVSDSETWEEYLAGHLGEPVRNYGVGGYGVYQAYLRLKRVVYQGRGTAYMLLNVFGMDDHFRSLDAWRRPRCGDWFQTNPPMLFHANPWNHVRFNLTTGELEERASLCPTPESLYQLCDEAWVLDTFHNDVALQMHLGCTGQYEVETAQMRRLADVLGAPFDAAAGAEAVRELQRVAGLKATMGIIEWACAFCAGEAIQLRVMLTHGYPELYGALSGWPRPDRELVDWLRERDRLIFDVADSHIEDIRDFNITVERYLQRLMIGHYNPAGNHFLAYALKDAMVDWLDPKPRTYPHKGETLRFDGHLLGLDNPGRVTSA